MLYKEFKATKQKTIDSFLDKYAFFAFSNEQLHEGLEEFNDQIKQGDKILNMGSGFFLLKSKFDEFMKLSESKETELHELMTSNYEFAVSAFNQEMSNNEYFINGQADYDVISRFGSIEYSYEKTAKDYLLEAGFDETMLKAYKEARKQHAQEALENDWY